MVTLQITRNSSRGDRTIIEENMRFWRINATILKKDEEEHNAIRIYDIYHVGEWS